MNGRYLNTCNILEPCAWPIYTSDAIDRHTKKQHCTHHRIHSFLLSLSLSLSLYFALPLSSHTAMGSSAKPCCFSQWLGSTRKPVASRRYDPVAPHWEQQDVIASSCGSSKTMCAIHLSSVQPMHGGCPKKHGMGTCDVPVGRGVGSDGFCLFLCGGGMACV